MDEELGAYVQPQQQAGGWADLLKDPIKQSALLSFGLQAMTGGWGNGTQQLGAALGAGASGASATAKAMQEQGVNDRDFAFKQAEGSANRSSREREGALNRDSRAEVAGIQDESRRAVAGMRVEGMLERARLVRQPQTSQEIKFYNDQLKAAEKTLSNDLGSMNVTGPAREELVRARALERLKEARERGVFGGPTSPAAVEGAITPEAKPAASPGAQPGAKPAWEAIKDKPQIQELLKSASGRRTLMRERPDLYDVIRSYAPSHE